MKAVIIDCNFRIGKGGGTWLMALALACLLQPADARGQEIATQWVDGERHRVRLFAGDVAGASPGVVMAFIEMSMDKGWKTYWRNPGTAGGIPPEFNWEKSKNIAKAEVLFPVPQVMSDKAGDVIGYREFVIFPVRITPADLQAPIEIDVTANYGICEKLCVPAETNLVLSVPVPPLPAAGEDAERAYGAVPRAQDSLKPGDPSGLKVERPAERPGLIRISATFPGDSEAAAMYLAVADGRYLPLPVRREAAGQTVVFEITFENPNDLAALKGAAVSVVMAGQNGQSEDVFVID